MLKSLKAAFFFLLKSQFITSDDLATADDADENGRLAAVLCVQLCIPIPTKE